MFSFSLKERERSLVTACEHVGLQDPCRTVLATRIATLHPSECTNSALAKALVLETMSALLPVVRRMLYTYHSERRTAKPRSERPELAHL